jgi:hypothetical protein
MATHEDHVVKRNEDEEDMCVVCHTRKRQGRGSTCHNPFCKKKGGRARYVRNYGRLQGVSKTVLCNTLEKKSEKEEPGTVCIYCLKRPVNSGRNFCFDRSCIARHARAKFPPRIHASTVNDEEKDSSDDDSSNSEDDVTNVEEEKDSDLSDYEGSCNDSASTPWDSDDSSEETYINYQESNQETILDASVNDEVSDEFSMSVEEDTLVEVFDDELTLEMCENCHRQPIFEDHPEIASTRLSYYFTLQEVEKGTVRF